MIAGCCKAYTHSGDLVRFRGSTLQGALPALMSFLTKSATSMVVDGTIHVTKGRAGSKQDCNARS